MLQPRSDRDPPPGYFCVLLLLCVFSDIARTGNADYLGSDSDQVRAGERFRRQDGEVTILSLEENAKSPQAVGILSSTARTFVQAGTTTEFTTQVLGTTLGRTYARLLSTGSRVFYDNSRPASRDKIKPSDAFLVFPTVLPKTLDPSLDSATLIPTAIADVIPTRQLDDVQKVQEINSNHESSNRLPLDELFDLSDTRQNSRQVLAPKADERENIVSVRKEYSVKRNSEIKVAKVKPNFGLPTFTVRNEFAPSGYSYDETQEKKEESLKTSNRNSKRLFKGGIPVKLEKKLDTVTYFGFADFTTIVGDTVIVFMPKTPNPQVGSVTSISGEATLRPEDAPMPVVTTVKTFMSHSPGMATKTVTGHSLSMHTTLPTIQADPMVRESKAYEPVYVSSEQDHDLSNRFNIDPSPSSFDYSDSIEPSILIDSSEGIKSSELATEPLSVYATTTTQVYNSAEEALGLVKSIGGTEAVNGTTTIFTSFVFGTIIDGAYKQLVQSASTVFINVGNEVTTTTGVGIGIAPSSTSMLSMSLEPEVTTPALDMQTTEEIETTSEHLTDTTSNGQIVFSEEITPENYLSNEVDTARKVDSSGKDHIIVPGEYISPQSTTEYITKVVPSTVYKTFTYLTTFFIPDDNGGQTTSIRSREVTSEDISYITRVFNSKEEETLSTTITPTEVVTEIPPTTTPQEYQTINEEENTSNPTEEIKLENTTPQPKPALELTTTQILRDPENEEEDNTTPALTTPKHQEGEEEVDLIFKTLYTTYTYLTTFFQESSTSVSSSEVVVTNIITTTLDNALATDPAVAGLFNNGLIEPAPTSVGIGRPTTKYFDESHSLHSDDIVSSTFDAIDNEKEPHTPTPALNNDVQYKTEDEYKTFYTTYTYFTTVFVDGESEVESRTEVYTNIISPSSLTGITPTSEIQLFSSDYVSVSPDEQVESPAKNSQSVKSTPVRAYDSTISRARIKDNEIILGPEGLDTERNVEATNVPNVYTYDTTMSRVHSTNIAHPVDEEAIMSAKQSELSKEEKLLLGISPSEDSEVRETVVVDVTSSSSGGSRKVYRESYDDPDDQITSESNTEEIEPSFSPTILLQTSYTTFTYFTTIYKGTTSDVISRLDTVTNVVTETLKPSDIEASLSPEEATLPITYFTTFTYWTTLYKDGSTMVTSREETISNIIKPTITESIESTDNVDITPTSTTPFILPTVLTSIIGGNSDIEAKQLDSNKSVTDSEVITPSPTTPEPIKENIEGNLDNGKNPMDSENNLTSTDDFEPTTYFTTYTYYTTSYIGNSTVLNSRLETETNIVTPTKASEDKSLDSNDLTKESTLNSSLITDIASVKPTGLISTIRTSEVHDGLTTLLSTDVFGTYIDGLYAQILESSTEILLSVKPSSTLPISSQTVQPTGVVSINEGKIVDADGISTTFFTTKAVGTYIDQLYAQVIESTTSIQVDEEKKTAAQTLDPSTTIVGSKSFRTGLVRLIEGSIVKDKTTTFYESRVIGTLIEGRYAQIIESTSSFKVEMTPTPVAGLTPTSVSPASIIPTATVSTAPSPAVIESSIGDSGIDGDEDNDQESGDEEDSSTDRSKSRLSFSTRKKTFTPVIRPFVSRPRPTFLPKKKTGDVGSATTITRNAFTPTITATPAVKSSDRGFGSSRNRFAGGRRSSSSNVIQATASASSARRFSGRRGSSTAGISPVSPSQSSFRGRSNSRIVPTSSSAFGASSRRGGFNYRTSSGLRSSSSVAGSSRFRVRPTLSSSISRPLQTLLSTTEDAINTNDIGGVTAITEDTLVTLGDEDQETSPPSTTTTESPRRSNNPLLRFRRPPILQRSSTTTTTPKPTTSPARRSSLLRRPDSRGAVTTPVTPTRNRATPTSTPRNRQRPSNSLFPPRGLLRKPTPAEEAEDEEKEGDNLDDDEQNDTKLGEENDFSDNDYEGSENSESQHSSPNETITTEAPKADRRGKAINTVQIRPFRLNRQPRQKRQATEYGTRNYRSRYQRTKSRTQSPDYYVDDSEPLPSEVPTTRTPSRFTPRSRGQTAQQSQPRVRPTKPTPSAGRAQFTLRDKSSSQTTRSNFKRPTNSRRRPSTPETPSVPQRPKPPRLRTQTTTHTQQQETTFTSRNGGRRFTNSRRPTSRSRYRDSTDFDTYSFSPSSFDGTITVTHQVPTEVTIPVVNGKVTEYKNVITAKPSLEILAPHQYTSATGKDGNFVIQLTSEVTSTLPNGVMEITKFVVYETPTTSITFTPTTLRGRKTSFSHIVPSTVYDVKQEISTVQPQIAANAPLANLLLSQLLLGNLNLQPNPQQLNPLLGLQNQQIVPPTPTTEYKTKTTTYVTTVTDHTSTVIPLTFRGKEILTTIVDSSTQVITATEYLTETVVITPTAALAANPQQINTLLLPALLQAQLLGQSPQQPTINPLLGTLQQQILPQDILNIQEEKLQVEEPTQRFVSRRRPSEDTQESQNSQEYDLEEIIEQPKPEAKTRKKVKVKAGAKKPPDVAPSLAETSIVTLYVSGRRPGDFSTILSTVTLGEESSVTVRKREAQFFFEDLNQSGLEFSKLPEIGGSFLSSDDSYINNYVMSALNEIPVEGTDLETQSLESIVGDVSAYITRDNSKINTKNLGDPTKINKDVNTEKFNIASSKTFKKSTGHFLSKGPAEDAPSQRIGQKQVNWSNKTIKNIDDSIFHGYSTSLRVKRQIDDSQINQPRRRKVRVRVPVQKRVNIDEDLTPSEAQRSQDITHQELLQTQDALSKLSDFGTRKIKVIRKRPKVAESETGEENPITHRRVAVRRRRPLISTVHDNLYVSSTQYLPDLNYHIQPSGTYLENPLLYSTDTLQPIEPLPRRKKVLVARRRPKPSSSIVDLTTRRKVLVTKKRPVVKTVDQIDPATIYSNFFVGLHTDYDYQNPSINTELEETNNDNNYDDKGYTTEEIDLSSKDEIKDFNQDGDIDNIRIPTWIPENQSHISYKSIASSEIENSHIPESIVWFYEPTDEIIIDITPTLEINSKVTMADDVESSVLSQSLTIHNDIVATKTLSHQLDASANFEESLSASIISDLPSIQETITEQEEKQSAPPTKPKTPLIPSTVELESSLFQPEETIEFEGAPKFVRPTRFSVTKKPSKVITGFPGTRRRQPPTTIYPSSTTSNEDSYQSKVPSTKRYGGSKSSFKLNSIHDTLRETIDVPPKTVYFEENIASSISSPSLLNDPNEQTTVTTPMLAESSINAYEKETYATPVTPTSYLTTTVTSTRLRTYTYVITRVSGEESIVTSSTSIKPALKTLTLTIPIVAATNSVALGDEGRGFQLATKVMSNGVEVIVAGDRTTMPGAPEVLRKLSATATRPITLAPSTLSDAMMMMLPQASAQGGGELLTNTYVTKYKYQTTVVQQEEPVVSSRQEVVTNVVTEERRPSDVVKPTSVTQITVTASPSLATSVYHTTYTYLNTLVDGDTPLVVTSRRTVANTVTAPPAFLQPSEPDTRHDTNTYLNTVTFTKTLADGSDYKIVTTEDVMTQVIITDTNFQASSVEIKPTPTAMTTDVVKTYFVTYTYFNTILDGEDTVVQSEVATSSDVVTEKFVITPKETILNNEDTTEQKTEKIKPTKAPETESNTNSINVFATKTYLTTYTYFTTLLQENNGKPPSTVVSSRTSVIQNLVTETLDTEMFDSNYLSSLRSSLQTDTSSIIATATLNDGQKMEITAVGEQTVKPTLTLSNHISSSFEDTTSINNVITGSTIIFFDENDQIDQFTPTPTKTLAIEVAGTTKINQLATTENIESSTDSTTDNSKSESLSAAESQALTLTTGDSDTEESHKSYETSILVSSTVTKNGATLLPGAQVIKFKDPNGNISIIPVSDPVSKHPDGTHSVGTGSNAAVNNFLSLGSLGINSLNALGPVINAMAGLIKSNLKSDQRRRNDSIGINENESNNPHLSKNPLMMYAGPKPPAVRSPIYIPVGGLAADSVAEESQNVERHNVFQDSVPRNKPSVVLGRPTMESPLLAGGIPISPGQVITTNSDVIIGKPSVHGVRPPEVGSKPYRKDDVPLGMKPPPLPKSKPNWPIRDHNDHYIPLSHHPSRDVPHRPQFHREPTYSLREPHPNYGNAYNHELFKHQESFKKNPHIINNRPINQNEYYIPPPRKEQNNVVHDIRLGQQNTPQYYPNQQNIQVYNNVPNNHFDTRTVVPSDTEAGNTINSNVEYVNPIQHAPILLPDNTDFVDQSSVNPLLVNIKPSQVANVIIPHGSSTALIYSGEHSQKGEIFNDPSPYPDAQIDHVVDALSTSRPSPEGEGITHAAHVPLNANNLDVPVAPHGINVAGNQPVYQVNENNPQVYQHNKPQTFQIENHEHYQVQINKQNQRPLPVSNKHNFINQQYYEKQPVESDSSMLDEYLKPPPPPSDHYLSTSSIPKRDDSLSDETVDQENGEVSQESNVRPLRPGQLPIELTAHPSTSMPIDPIDDEDHKNTAIDGSYSQKSRPVRLDQDINFSVVNSKPVQLDGFSSLNNQAPIINGRPGVNKFTGESQATLAVGLTTQLRPDSEQSHNHNEHNFDHNERPKINFNINPALFAAISPEIIHDRPKVVKPIQINNNKKDNFTKTSNPVYDNTVQSLSLNEKPPPPPTYNTPQTSQSSANTGPNIQESSSRPYAATGSIQNQFDRNSQHDVVGLSPPPPQNTFTTHEETSTRPLIPLGTSHRRPLLPPPRKSRPPPPYKFEIPPPQMPEQVRPTEDNFESLRSPTLPDTLSPPKLAEVYLENTMPNRPTTNKKPITQPQWTAENDDNPIIVSKPDIINPVLQGVLRVEEQPQQPEVITADSKVMTNIIKGHRTKPEIGIKITGSQPSLQTVVVGKPVPVPVTDVISNVVISPTAVHKPNLSQNWQESYIVGSETIIDNTHNFATPTKEEEEKTSNIRDKPSSILVTTGVTTIFNDLFTRPSTSTKFLKPTKSIQNYHTAISVVVQPNENHTKSDNAIDKDEQKDHHKIVLQVIGDEDEEAHDGIVTAPPPTTFVVTHTQTKTVTTTETTVVHTKGKEPSTHTLLLTKTQTSTLLDTVTEVHTLVKQTSILATVTTTIPQATSTIYTGSVEPEEYLVYPQPEIESPKPAKKETKPAIDPHDNESIFVVMTDKKPGTVNIHTVSESESKLPPEIQVPDEANEINPDEIRQGQVFTHPTSDNECWPECKATRNELCQKIDNVMRCVCRPGFARMFPDRPCKPTYTYTMRLSLERYGKDKIRYSGPLEDPTSVPYQRLIDATREGLDRTVMQSDLRDIYHGIEVKGFEPASLPDSAVVKYYIQLSDNTEESRLQDVLRKSLRSNNYSLGGTEVYASKEQIQYLLAEDFDECTDTKYHDCSEEAQCFNLRGSYTCSCKEGFSDLSPNTQYPGRVCSAEQIGCELCNFHGTCYSRNNEEIMCECFQWYGGATCQINLKVLLLVLVTVAVCLAVLLIVCCVLACMRRRDRPRGPAMRPGRGFRRYRSHAGGTGDKRAMISVDTSSEGSVDNTPPAYIKQAAVTAQRQKVLRKAASKGPAPLHVPAGVTVNTEQRDRSLTVMIPRAKYRPAPAQPTNTLLTMSTFGPEQKLLNYLNPEGRSTPDKQGSRNTSRKPSNSTSHQSEQVRSRKPSSQLPAQRKPSTGALVSAGFEVSATVGRTKELDESFLEEPHTDLSQPGFNTIRTGESCIIVDIPPPPTLEAELEDIITKVDQLTVSEARSYDETTIHPPTKSLHRDYDSKRLSSSSHRANDESHTMVERDIGSTFMMPQTHLFKPDRGSDISNFDSL